ncbi:MAG: AbrB/MazE/SpoVT family DNA-binding domain-containing protein [Tepidisphaeraceae bacterium]
MPTTVQKWGNSLGIRIPKSVAEQVDLRTGTEVEFDTSGGVLTVRPRARRPRRHTLASLLAKAKGPSPHRKLARDASVGRELL